MTDRPWVEGIFDRTPHPFGAGPVDPIIHDASIAARRQRTVNFAAKRYVDMMFVTGLDRATADRHFRLRAAPVPSGLDGHQDGDDLLPAAQAALAAGRFTVKTDAADRRVTVRWNDPSFAASVTGHAIARSGYGGILLGPRSMPDFNPAPIARASVDRGKPWPHGDAVEAPAEPPAGFAAALADYFAASPGTYGVLVASPDRILAEQYTASEEPTG